MKLTLIAQILFWKLIEKLNLSIILKFSVLNLSKYLKRSNYRLNNRETKKGTKKKNLRNNEIVNDEKKRDPRTRLRHDHSSFPFHNSRIIEHDHKRGSRSRGERVEKILMERFRLSAGDRETFFSVESARRAIYTLPARHPLILFGLRLSPSLSHFTACFTIDELGIHRSLPIRNMEIKCRNFLGFGVWERQSWV